MKLNKPIYYNNYFKHFPQILTILFINTFTNTIFVFKLLNHMKILKYIIDCLFFKEILPTNTLCKYFLPVFSYLSLLSIIIAL